MPLESSPPITLPIVLTDHCDLPFSDCTPARHRYRGLLPPNLYADDDTLGLHLLLGDGGSAYFDMSLPWTPSLWTCGPRPPSFIAEGGPVPGPHHGASRHAHLLMAAIYLMDVLRAPPLGVTDLAAVDVTRPQCLGSPVPRHPRTPLA